MSDLLEYKGYSGTVEYSMVDNVLFGKVLGVKSLISYEGDDIESIKKDFESAVDDYLEMCAENGIEPEKVYKGSFNVRISPKLHEKLALYSASHNQTLNSTVEEAIKKHVNTLLDIEDEYDLEAYDKAMQEYQKNPISYTHEEVRRMLENE